MLALRKKAFAALLACAFCVDAMAEVRLPRLVSDGMVLQRDTPLKIRGQADPGEEISIEFAGQHRTTAANSAGDWQVTLEALPAGGPHRMQIRGENRIVLNDILVGDVWLASGQSNMEYPMSRVSHQYPKAMASADNRFIRQFAVPQRYDFQSAREDFESGEWKKVTPETIADFSAVAYFFASELYREYRIPVGIINASLGGSPAEAWISEESLKPFPQHHAELQRFKNDELIRKIEESDRKRIDAWYQQAAQRDAGLDPENPWHKAAVNPRDWGEIDIPGYWADTGAGELNGVVWFTREFHLPQELAARAATLVLGRIVDADTTYINGVEVGNTTYQYPRRRYAVPENLLKAGVNTIAIRVTNERGRGGFVPEKNYALVVGEREIDLSGRWRYRVGASMQPLQGQTFVRWKPAGLYNAMLHPLRHYPLKGVIWYQGESNVGRAAEYEALFPALIRDWRNTWQQPQLPFLFVQLANFLEARDTPTDSDWAQLRDAQRKALAQSNTGMAVAIDIGEWNDIHPLNKKEVGVRLSLAAQRVAYGEMEAVSSGPLYESMQLEGERIRLRFSGAGGGLVSAGGDLKHFAIAGADGHFVWAKAEIEKGEILVWSEQVPEPVAVRYAWADNPQGANLYNREGLPASPFRTDDW